MNQAKLMCVALVLGFTACGDNLPTTDTWGDAVTAWGEAWCGRQERCDPSFHDQWTDRYSCLGAVLVANCNTRRFDCEAPYPWLPFYYTTCAEETAALTCEASNRVEACINAFMPVTRP